MDNQREEASFHRTRRVTMLVVAAGIAALAALFVWLFDVLVQPAPPRSVVMSTGAKDGAYHAFAERYRQHLAQYGVDLILKPSHGSVENMERLKSRRDGVQVALVQGGIASAQTAPGIVTLGSMFYEPLWLFWRGDRGPASRADFLGKRIAVGSPGSGTRALATQLLGAHGIDATVAQLDERGGLEAASGIERGDLDAAIFVNAPEAPAIRRLMDAKGIELVSARRADAYVRQFPFLHKLVLPAGAMDVARDVPDKDKVLIAATANLLATEDIHPVIVDLLLEAARKVHSPGGFFNGPGVFPAVHDHDFPVSADAERIYHGQYSFLRKYLPFWAAIWVQRFVFFAIPVLAIGIPLLRFLPAAYQWGARRRIYRWYGELKFLELELRRGSGDATGHLKRLDEIEDRVNALKVPLAYSSEYYTLRMHIGLVRQLIDSLQQKAPAPAANVADVTGARGRP